MAPSVLLLLLLLGFVSSLPPPRSSFPLGSGDRPLVHFSVQNTTTLLLSPDGSTLYVGALDAVLSLDVSHRDVISLKNKVEWRPSNQDIRDCQGKGRDTEVDCLNWVHVLQQINSSHLFVCGSFAFSPRDAVIDAASLSMAPLDGVRERARCPFSPRQRSAALAEDGELFTATTTDFRGLKPQISRHFSRDGRQDVSQDTSVPLLEEPDFVAVASDPSQRKLYFFFSEVGTEFSFVDELRIARVAQVCKDDVGGQRTLQNRWTSFAKAALLCRRPGQLVFNELQDVFTLPPPPGANASDTLFYGVFTSQWSSSPESAVCAFTLRDVRAAFSGSYRTFDTETYQWTAGGRPGRFLGQCGLGGASDSDLAQVKKSFLTSRSVAPLGGGPLLLSSGRRYTHVAAMRTPASNGRPYTVLFLLTETGVLHKAALLGRGVHVVEEIQVFRDGERGTSLLLSPAQDVVYVGTSVGVSSVPVSRCSAHSSCSQCVLARDPLCGWSHRNGVCGSVDVLQDTVQVLEDGDVEEQCRGQNGTVRTTGTVQTTEISAPLHQVVRLPCTAPSRLAALSWSSPQFRRQLAELFLRSADGSLSFHAAAATYGSYRCEAVEAGVTEVVASYVVRQVATPRAVSPARGASGDESYEEVPSEEVPSEAPPSSAPSGGSEGSMAPDHDHETKTVSEDETTEEDPGLKESEDGPNATPTPRSDARAGTGPAGAARLGQKSYYGELVVVSLLLALCVCALALGGVHVWRQRKTGLTATTSPLVSPEDGCRTAPSPESDPSPESVPSLSEDAPELRGRSDL